jgi:hypothetical protein
MPEKRENYNEAGTANLDELKGILEELLEVRLSPETNVEAIQLSYLKNKFRIASIIVTPDGVIYISDKSHREMHRNIDPTSNGATLDILVGPRSEGGPLTFDFATGVYSVKDVFRDPKSCFWTENDVTDVVKIYKEVIEEKVMDFLASEINIPKSL